MKHIKLFENMDKNFGRLLDFPKKDGWYWVLIDGYDSPTPCWFMLNSSEEGCFLPGGMGDSSSNGLFKDDISSIGPEIIVPQF